MRTCKIEGTNRPNRARGSRNNWISSLISISFRRFSTFSLLERLLERPQREGAQNRGKDAQGQELREQWSKTGPLEEDDLDQRQVVASREHERDCSDDDWHLVDRKHEPGKQERRQKAGHQRNLAGRELRLGCSGNPESQQQYGRQEERRREQHQPNRAAERHPEPPYGDYRAECGVEQAQQEVGDQFPDGDLQRGDRRGYQLLHRAALPLARHGQRGQEGSHYYHHQHHHPGHDEVAAVEVLVEPGPRIDRDWSLDFGQALGLEILDLYAGRISGQHGFRVAEDQVGGVVVDSIDDPLHFDGAALAKLFGEVAGYNHTETATPGIDRGSQSAIVGVHHDNSKVRRGLEMLEQVLALLAALAIEDAHRHVLLIETDSLPHQHHQHHRHEKHDREAPRIAANLHHFLALNGENALQVHDCSARTSRAGALEPLRWSPVSATKASSRLGRIRAIRRTRMPPASIAACTVGIASSASPTTM